MTAAYHLIILTLLVPFRLMSSDLKYSSIDCFIVIVIVIWQQQNEDFNVRTVSVLLYVQKSYRVRMYVIGERAREITHTALDQRR